MYLEVIVPERLLGIRSYIVVRKKLYMADDFRQNNCMDHDAVLSVKMKL